MKKNIKELIESRLKSVNEETPIDEMYDSPRVEASADDGYYDTGRSLEKKLYIASTVISNAGIQASRWKRQCDDFKRDMKKRNGNDEYWEQEHDRLKREITHCLDNMEKTIKEVRKYVK